MEKKYREIEFGFGDLNEAFRELVSHDDLVCGEFNGKMLYSDTDSLDSVYKKVTGKTKHEFDEMARKSQEDYQRKKREHKEAIPKLTEEWIAKGKEVLDEKYLETWNKCVPIRLGDLYEGMELGATLEIVEKLNGGCDLKEAKEIIMNQGHSGMSFGLVCSMIGDFCDRGNEFVKFARQ